MVSQLLLLLLLLLQVKQRTKEKNRHLRERVIPTLLEHEMQRCLRQSRRLNFTYF